MEKSTAAIYSKATMRWKSQFLGRSLFSDCHYDKLGIDCSHDDFAAKGGAMQAFSGMSAGTAVAVIAYVGKYSEPLESIGVEIQNIQSAVAGVYRINEFLREEERKMPPKDIELPKPGISKTVIPLHFGASLAPEPICLRRSLIR